MGDRVYFDPIWSENFFYYKKLIEIFNADKSLDRTVIKYIDGVLSPLELLQTYKERPALLPTHGLSIISGLQPILECQNELVTYTQFIKDKKNFDKSCKKEIYDAFDLPDHSKMIDQYVYAIEQASDLKRLDGFSPYQFLHSIFHSGLRETNHINKADELKTLMESLSWLIDRLDEKMLEHTNEFAYMADIWLSEKENKPLPLKDYIEWAYKKKFTSKWLQYLFTFRKGKTQLKREKLLKEWMKSRGYKCRDDIDMENPEIWLALKKIYPMDFKQEAYTESKDGGKEMADTPDKFFHQAEWFRYKK